MGPDAEPRRSWICRDAFERERFLDLHSRLLPANSRILIGLVVLIALATPFSPDLVGLLPAGLGIVAFAIIQRSSLRFARPELWVAGGVLGAEAMITLAVSLHGAVLTPALALLCWPVAGFAGRYRAPVAWLGTAYAGALATAAILYEDPSVLAEDPLQLTLLLAALGSVTAIASVLRDSDVENRGAAILDPLTGMLNRTALDTRTAEIEHQSQVTGEPVAVLVADLDHFKAINDTHGHAAGDAVLREVAYRIRRELRAYDLAYRLGGEEFVVLLLGGTPAATEATAEQLRAAVSAEPVAGMDITVTIGVAASEPGTPFVWADVFAMADAALYRAKREGRDRVLSGP